MNDVSDQMVNFSAIIYIAAKSTYPSPLQDSAYKYSFQSLFNIIPQNVSVNYILAKKLDTQLPNIYIKYNVTFFDFGSSENYDFAFLSEFDKYDLSRRYYRVRHEDSYRKTIIELRTKYHGYNSIFFNKLCETLNNNKIKCDFNGNIKK
ncbi:hypothetical protein HZS_966 [Henneguya salminicola]|nr:hypothetical protein HZS_966 [Henneguya salminicola]